MQDFYVNPVLDSTKSIGIKTNINNIQKDITINSNNLETSVTKDQDKTQNKKPDIFINPPTTCTQEAVDGIKYDFNDGLRILFPQNGKKYRCLFADNDTDIVLYCNDTIPGCLITSTKKFYINFKLEIYEQEKYDKPIFTHEFNCKDKDVLIQIPDGAIGDAIAWFSYVEPFYKKTQCKCHVMMPKRFIELYSKQYPDLHFVTREEAEKLTPYATYRLGLYFKGDVDHQPWDFRLIGLHTQAGYLLGLRDKELLESAPRFDLSAKRQIKEKYVVIATHSSSHCKMWNNPAGWREVIKYLKEQGYRVLCIDKLNEYGENQVWHHTPNGCEDFTGDLPLQERINLIKDADMFIGVSSGLSWIAWCCKVPVIMISGFTAPWNEFYTPYRVINEQVCHGCWNDTRCEFVHEDFLWCPRKTKPEEKFECTKMISSKMVINQINKIIKK